MFRPLFTENAITEVRIDDKIPFSETSPETNNFPCISFRLFSLWSRPKSKWIKKGGDICFCAPVDRVCFGLSPNRKGASTILFYVRIKMQTATAEFAECIVFSF
ncbi:hypothetical protein CDAR_13251 [Caerostris darwini]|uniref:Uncharacterized protein n=1 Tax=Caerostris darwini TaxID=1538125 RepID=A0AAV4R0A9_9ARAC|nr:hypothetical protein CDAR_13251 [Caerostris darwini]